MSFIAIKSKKGNKVENLRQKFDLEIPMNEVRISEQAAVRIRELREKEETKPAFLRVGIVGGGCSGLSYIYSFEVKQRSDDLIFRNGDVAICVDPKSMKLVGGSLLHWQDSMKRMGFMMLNKDSRRSCSCGESFSV